MKTPSTKSVYWSQIISEQQRSGQSIAEFCSRRGLAQPSFFVWRRRLGIGAETMSGFVELKTSTFEALVVAPARTLAELELPLPCGRRLLVRRGFDRDLLRELVSPLEGRPSQHMAAASADRAVDGRRPETFDFLGFTHICAKKHWSRGFIVRRRSIKKSPWAKLAAVKEQAFGSVPFSPPEQT